MQLFYKKSHSWCEVEMTYSSKLSHSYVIAVDLNFFVALNFNLILIRNDVLLFCVDIYITDTINLHGSIVV